MLRVELLVERGEMFDIRSSNQVEIVDDTQEAIILSCLTLLEITHDYLCIGGD
jgi:hypothetical protein